MVEEVGAGGAAFSLADQLPDVMARGGFDGHDGNPPWERNKDSGARLFRLRAPEIAMAATASIRGGADCLLCWTRAGGHHEQRLHHEFEFAAKRIAEASSASARESGRFPLTGRGDINTYALFAELFQRLKKQSGAAGIVVPTGIATDSTTAEFFGTLVRTKQLRTLFDFENRDGLFPAIDSRIKLCVLAMASSDAADFAFFMADPQLLEQERRFSLTPAMISKINPNTGTAPIFSFQI